MAEATAATVVPTFNDVLAARERIARYLQPTALNRYPALDELIGTETWVKHENHQPICAFKVRGGINLLSQLPDGERRGGVIVTHGVDFDEARVYAARLAEEHGYRYIHSGNEPHLIAGVATQALEILERQPDIEVIIVPIGGGSGAAGTCIVAKTINPKIQVIGVQSAEAPAAQKSWKAHRLLEDRMGTIAEGLATRTAFELPQRILWEHLDDFLLVPDAEIRTAVRLMIETTRNLAEPAGAAPLAAAIRLKDRLKGKRVALILSGSNITTTQLRELLG